jgi:hypothetical protein
MAIGLILEVIEIAAGMDQVSEQKIVKLMTILPFTLILFRRHKQFSEIRNWCCDYDFHSAIEW